MKSYLPYLCMLPALAACSQTVETRISNSGVAGMAAAPIFADADVTPQPALAEVRQQVVTALAKKGYAVTANGPLNLEVSWSARPASLSLGSDKARDDIAKAKGRGLFGGCAKQEYRLSVTLTNIADGAQLYHSTAAEYHCKTPVAGIIPALAKAAVADVGAPRGEYKVDRRL